jgi:hypothetical protein
MKLSNIKPNPQNPRLIKDERFKKLVQSIKDFPEMMVKRPMVCVTDVDGKLFPLGGNMRLKALKEAGYTDIPDEWVTMADEWTQEQRNEFIIKDNISFGEHDWEALKDWDTEQLEEWGLEGKITVDNIEKIDLTDSDFEDEIKKINDDNCQLPIVPTFHEKYSYFIILCDNEIDEQFIRNTFGLNIKHTSHKSTDDRLSNIISVEKIQEVCLK